MARAKGVLPQMRLHAASGQARIRLGGEDVYLGRWGSPEAEAAYRRVVARFIETGGQRPRSGSTRAMSTVELAELYLGQARAHYTRGGQQTTGFGVARRALILLERSGLASGAAAQFGPKALSSFQVWLASDPKSRWSRWTIRKYASIVVSMFRWGVAEELVPESAWRALTAVRGLAKGRRPAAGVKPPREPEAVRSPDPEVVEAAIAHLTPMLAAMITIHRITGMRVGELLAMTPGAIEPQAGGEVLVYRVPDWASKVAHLEIGRRVYLGPRCAEALRPWLEGVGPEEPVWSGRRLALETAAARAAGRSTPVYGRQSASERAERRRAAGVPERRVGRRVTREVYRAAIMRACDRAFPPPEGLDEPALVAWRRAHRFSPRQLRHAAATAISRAEQIDVARLLLGHASERTTRGYVDPNDIAAIEAALRLG